MSANNQVEDEAAQYNALAEWLQTGPVIMAAYATSNRFARGMLNSITLVIDEARKAIEAYEANIK